MAPLVSPVPGSSLPLHSHAYRSRSTHTHPPHPRPTPQPSPGPNIENAVTYFNDVMDWASPLATTASLTGEPGSTPMTKLGSVVPAGLMVLPHPGAGGLMAMPPRGMGPSLCFPPYPPGGPLGPYVPHPFAALPPHTHPDFYRFTAPSPARGSTPFGNHPPPILPRHEVTILPKPMPFGAEEEDDDGGVEEVCMCWA